MSNIALRTIQRPLARKESDTMHFRILIITILALVQSACGGGNQQEPDAVQGSATNPTPAAVGALRIAPGRLSSCEPVIAEVNWDVRSAHPEVVDVDILVGPDTSPTLFASGGAYGSARTGAWTVPGAIFRLRDRASGVELDRATVSGPACS